MRYGNGHYASGPMVVTCSPPCVGSDFAAECFDLPIPPSTLGDGIIDEVKISNHGIGYDARYPPTLACPSDSTSSGLGQLFVPKIAGGARLQAIRASGAQITAKRAFGAKLFPVRPHGAVVQARRASGASFELKLRGSMAHNPIWRILFFTLPS